MFISEFFIINLGTTQCLTRKWLNKKNYIILQSQLKIILIMQLLKNIFMKNFSVMTKGLWHVGLRK